MLYSLVNTKPVPKPGKHWTGSTPTNRSKFHYVVQNSSQQLGDRTLIASSPMGHRCAIPFSLCAAGCPMCNSRLCLIWGWVSDRFLSDRNPAAVGARHRRSFAWAEDWLMPCPYRWWWNSGICWWVRCSNGSIPKQPLKICRESNYENSLYRQ